LKNLWSKMILIFAISCLIAFSVAMVGCTQNTDTEVVKNVEKPLVAVSIVPEKTFVKAVAGDLVDTVVLIPPGESPANYAPTPQKIEALSNASLYFAIGVPSEKANILPKLPDINSDIRLVALPDEVRKNYPDREFAPGKRDPHIWISPRRVEVIVSTVARELSAIDPANKDIYERNAQEYNNNLKELDQNIKSSLKDLPGKTFIVYHPAFGYFADDYGLEMLAIENGGKKATAGDIQGIIDSAREKDIKVIFYQASITSRQADTIAEEIGGRTEQIDPLAANYIENLEKMATAFAGVLK